MKTLTILFVSLLSLLSAELPVLNTYIVKKGSVYAQPALTGRVGDTLEFYFRLPKQSWSQLYQNTDRSTHKICGVSDIFGYNSIRLGVRRHEQAAKADSGLIAVCYLHTNGKTTYPAIKLGNRTTWILYDVDYFCRLVKVEDGWNITLYDPVSLYVYGYATQPLKISSSFRKVMGVYVEVGQQPSLWEIKTLLKVTKYK